MAERFLDLSHLNHIYGEFRPVDTFQRTAGYKYLTHAEFFSLTHTLLHARDRTDLAAEANLAAETDTGGNSHVDIRRKDSGDDCALKNMAFSKNNNSSITPPQKRLDEMTPKEVDELLERLI